MRDVLNRLRSALSGRYTLERELGHGGMATVWLARERKHDRPVALKVLRPEIAAALGPERFLREITLTAGLHHPHILPLLDSGEAAGRLFYVMPYVEGESLRDRLRREQQLPLEDALQITREVADALGYAHQHGIVHRDIKPENILLENGHAVVADFGIAKALTAAGDVQLTATGIAVGTPAYMSPEQGAGSREVDGRSDLYSLGCVLYEMLSGETPYLGGTPQAILAKKLTEPVPRITVLRSTVPASIETAVTRALARAPADRFHTAHEFGAALAAETGQTWRARAARASRRRILAAVGSACVVLVLALAAWARFGRSSSLALVMERTTPVTTEPGLEIDPALSPDGAFLAYAGGPLLAPRIYVRQVEGGRPVAVGDSSGAMGRWPRWSPDGRRLLYCAGTRVMVVAAFGGTARPVVDADGRVMGADWSPDGSEIAFAVRDSLYIAAVGGGAPRVLGRFVEPHSPAWSPDGRAIALVSGNSPFVLAGTYGNSAVSTIVLAPVGGGRAMDITDGRSLAVSPAWLADGRGLLFVSDREGPRDVYLGRLGNAGKLRGAFARVTQGTRPHSITVSRDGRRVGYNLFTTSANIWSLHISQTGTANASTATPLTRGSQVIETLTISADGGWVYYDSDQSGRRELYRIAATGGEAVQLTDAPGMHFWPTPSPDGRELAFQSQRNGTRDIFVMPADGGAVQAIRVGPGEDNAPVWFPDGRRIGFTHTGGDLPDGYYVVERAGRGWSRPERIAEFATGWGSGFSPDGRAVLYDKGVSLESLTLRDGARRVLYVVRGPQDPTIRLARYSSDGQVYFLGQVGAQRGIFVVSPKGGVARQVVRFDDPSRQPIWGGFDTDGKRLYFTFDEGQSDVWVADVRLK